MIKIIFKDVGQGDSIILKWDILNVQHIGVIDCALHHGSNPILDDIKSEKVSFIDFIILSHLHADHFSGMGELLEYCIVNNIKIGKFYHTFENQYFKILSAILVTQKNLKMGEKFFSFFSEASNKDIIEELDRITHNTNSVILDSLNELMFLSPSGKDYLDFSNRQARYTSKKPTTLPDLNNLSSVVKITNKTTAALLTADTTVRQLKKLKGKIEEEIVCVQVPHHGSIYNHCVEFWDSLRIATDCPAVFSVGDVTRDQLPDLKVVEYFDSSYFVEATNFVYGIEKYFSKPSPDFSKRKITSSMLNSFSILRSNTISSLIPNRFSGDVVHEIN